MRTCRVVATTRKTVQILGNQRQRRSSKQAMAEQEQEKPTGYQREARGVGHGLGGGLGHQLLLGVWGRRGVV